MRFLLVDADQLMTSLVEAMLDDLGHEVVGVTGSPAHAVEMIGATHPQGVIIDLAHGYSSDFDVVEVAQGTSATAIVFTYGTDDAITSRYHLRPVVVAKPDLVELERVVAHLGEDLGAPMVEDERRGRPSRTASGRVPTNLADAQAFYESLDEAVEGDALLAVDIVQDDPGEADGFELAARVQELLRKGDRVLASPRSVKVFLPGGEEVGLTSLLQRLKVAEVAPHSARISSVVIAADEHPGDAFARLRGTDA